VTVHVDGFYLQGSRTSYVRLARWHSCSNSSMSLDFRTSLSDALLMYADDGGQSLFMLLAINNGSLLARINVATDHFTPAAAAASSSSSSSAGSDHPSIRLVVNVASRPVNDRHWHTVYTLSYSRTHARTHLALHCSPSCVVSRHDCLWLLLVTSYLATSPSYSSSSWDCGSVLRDFL